ncbi:glycosyl transferase family 25 [Paraburkholderia bannensis]|uniref:Glycosyl transferase family 25 n=1 Tax=Paraburkholderia bannensis TaxID=765414 RepID=A0A7W9TZ42_9BURK|nr:MULTISPECIES: glycosyltransferase family 25 protein [Paraburkholderia]MBB3257982.1 glycosyl transferase family 25 [Paraburkholderia sp. WP4_3_2]MBB6102995.1 glycosyl transferase family 25 [Paraburkholderia bannensis]
MKIFVINLDKSTDRLSHMTRQIERLGYAWERFPACGPAQVEEMAKALALPLLHGACTMPEKGVALSHYAIWNMMLDEGIDHALVLEDDVHFCHDAKKHLESINEEIARGLQFDIIKIETFLAGIFVDREGIRLSDQAELHRLRSNHGGAAAYIISREGCRKMIARLATADRAVDLVMFDGDLESMRVFQLHPALCIQDFLRKQGKTGIVSTVGMERSESDYHSAWLEKLKSPFRGGYYFAQTLRVWGDGQMKIRSRYKDRI